MVLKAQALLNWIYHPSVHLGFLVAPLELLKKEQISLSILEIYIFLKICLFIWNLTWFNVLFLGIGFFSLSVSPNLWDNCVN